jgi:hypothetical protein
MILSQGLYVRGNVKKYKRHVSKRMSSNLTSGLLVLNTPFGGWQMSQMPPIAAYCRMLPPVATYRHLLPYIIQVTTDQRQIQLDHHGGTFYLRFSDRATL